MDFSKALACLRDGFVVCRKSNPKFVIIKQMPADIPTEVIPKMTSLNQKAKDIFIKYNVTLKYRNQLLMVNLESGVATTYVPTTEDCFALDWQIVED